MKRHKRLIVHRQAVVNNLTTGRPLIKGNILKASMIPPDAIKKDFTLTSAQISASSAGFRADPLAGNLAPDAVFAGGTIVLVQATNDDIVRIQNSGGVKFPDIDGDVYLRIGPYIGPARIDLKWDIDVYSAVVPGIYNYLVQQIGLPTGMLLSAGPI